MDFNEVIKTRRSVRKFNENKKPTKEQIEEIIKAASLAPSWKNSQTARYYCILSKNMEESFRNNCLPEANNNKTIGATLFVTTFVKNRAGFNKETGQADNEVGNGWGFYDLGLNNENFVLKAKELGLDTLIMGIRDESRIRELLNISDNEIIASVIALGYRDINPDMPRRKELNDVIKFV